LSNINRAWKSLLLATGSKQAQRLHQTLQNQQTTNQHSKMAEAQSTLVAHFI